MFTEPLIGKGVNSEKFHCSAYRMRERNRAVVYPVASAQNLFKEIGPRSDTTKRPSCSESNHFDTQMVSLKYFFQKVYFEKKKKPGPNSPYLH